MKGKVGAFLSIFAMLASCGSPAAWDAEVEAYVRVTANALLNDDEEAFVKASLMAGDTSADGGNFVQHANGKPPDDIWDSQVRSKFRSLRETVASFSEKHGPYSFGGILKSGEVKGPPQFWVFKTYVELKGKASSLVLFIPVTVRCQRGRIMTDVPKTEILFWKDWEKIKGK